MKIDVMACHVCDKSVSYFEEEEDYIEKNCDICGEEFLAYGTCENGHYVCDKCISNNLGEIITEYALNSKSKNPQEIIKNIMMDRKFYIHGPLHHYLMPASLLTAYKNSGGDINLEEALEKARVRSSGVPGGACGIWGACGASIGSGIFFSIITDSSPMAEKEWRLPNSVTSKTLEEISKYGGPRCCKRNAFLTVPIAVNIANENFNVQMEMDDEFRCFFFPRNHQCLEENCKFHPKYN